MHREYRLRAVTFSPQKFVGKNAKQVRVRASPSVTRVRRDREPLVARKYEEASSSSHLTHSQSRTHAKLFCAHRHFSRKRETAPSLQEFKSDYS